MSAMFSAATNFNNGADAGLGGEWGGTFASTMSSVADMEDMFRNASSFNQDIKAWNTSSVQNMDSMFRDATVFDNGGSPNDLSSWAGNLLQVETVANMFEGSGFGSSGGASGEGIRSWTFSEPVMASLTDMFADMSEASYSYLNALTNDNVLPAPWTAGGTQIGDGTGGTSSTPVFVDGYSVNDSYFNGLFT